MAVDLEEKSLRGSAYLPLLLLVSTIGGARAVAGRKAGDPIYPSLKNISCYQCHSEFDGPSCYNTSQFNATFRTCTQSIAKGGGCAVYRLDTSEQSLGVRTHSIERVCTDSCEPDCVIVGERHKLHLCTSCCNQTLCNVDNGAAGRHRIRQRLLDLITAAILASASVTASASASSLVGVRPTFVGLLDV